LTISTQPSGAACFDIIKFFKKIYFTSNYYNKSLLSTTPVQVYYNPNPFLLSIISPYKKGSFKISEINPNDFWLSHKNNFDHHNFLWLSLIDRKVDGKNIQKINTHKPYWLLVNLKFGDFCNDKGRLLEEFQNLMFKSRLIK